MYRRTALGLLASACLVRPANAAPRRYLLDRQQSKVAFSYTLNGQRLTGTMPVVSADILLDLDAPRRSSVSATIDASRARAGLIFVTDAIRHPSVLDTSHHPYITFTSKSVQETAKGARLRGALTIKGVTRDVALDSIVYRQRGTEAGNRSNLSILMTGIVDRRAFGASGYAQFVGPDIGLNILTRITLADGA